MANPTTKKRKSGQSDFKRVKAKVGKRALKPANETNTEAKFSTLAVAHQNVSRDGKDKAGDKKRLEEEDGTQELISTRGLSLDDIVVNLRHPASAVRISAARGLKDAVSRKVAAPEVIRSHLALLMPVSAKCLVDEDTEVRRLALEVMKETIGKIRSVEARQGESLLPFMPLLMAHVTSALHSLDRKTQMDGACMVEMMSSTIPSLVAPFAQDFLPAYCTLLSHRTQGVQKSSTKKEAANSETTTYKVLRSLYALLKTSNVKRKVSSSITESFSADLTIMPDGRDVNAIFVPSSQATSSELLSLHTLDALSSLSTSGQSEYQMEMALKPTAINISLGTATDLLGKIRDLFAEAIQPNKEKQDPKEILLILRSAHLFFLSCKPNVAKGQSSGIESFASVWRQYTSLMMTQFQQSGPVDLMAETDLEICITTLDSNLEGMEVETSHVNKVIGYLFAELERSKPSMNDKESRMKDDARPQVQDMLFGAVEKLLLISKNSTLYVRVVKAVESTFFSKEMMDAESSVRNAMACSPIACRVVMLSRLIFARVNWSILIAGVEQLDPLLRQILQGLASFLGPWASDYLFETEVVINILHSVVRRLDATEESSLVNNCRTCLVPLLEPRKKNCSIFEEFPAELQRKIIGLIVILQSPTQEMLDCLVSISARCWIGSSDKTVSPLIASQLLWSIHSIKRTIPMQSFLGFLAGSIGISKKPFGKLQSEADAAKVNRQDIIRFDPCVDLVGSIFCQCDLVKVLGLVQPLLERWLQVGTQGSNLPEKVLSARAAISIIARCLSSFEGCGVFLNDIAPTLAKSLLPAICYLLKQIPATRGDGAKSADKDPALDAFLEPISTIFMHEGHLFQRSFSELASQIESYTMAQQTNVVLALTRLASDVRLAKALQGSAELLEDARRIETKLASGNLERSSGVLRSLIEVSCSAKTIDSQIAGNRVG